ncbi:transglycosylase SLT domain-containing protein [Methylobacterium sp. Leaf117]|uniref:transglycosylase SLT domain-containing protein n=1 Tax=Methylobacterium sp. Leaf117 TaxID=1736260 RepID=UPI0006FF6DCB|nr:transglycosylase SLT domain-containing protein [Methylobacterium sp. Leaf117]KQP88438.1 lytic transglycosylase [Methylobacterium sp. Leaf117]
MMGVFPEPALCADDVSRLVPNETFNADDTVAWLPRTERRARRNFAALGRRTLATLLAGAILGAALPQNALAPAAAAHDRIDERAVTAQALARESAAPIPTAPVLDLVSDLARDTSNASDWAGVPVIEQEPATLTLIESDLAALAPSRDASGAEHLRFGDMAVRREIVDTILRAATETGVDPAYMMALADKESSFSTTVKASTSSAEGLFQFLSGTWLELIRTYGARHGLADEAAAVKGRGSAITIPDEATRTRVLRLRQDPYIAALMAGELINRDKGRIEQRIGRDLSTAELYFAHFLGTASAGRFLALTAEKPDQVAKQVFKAAAKANRSLFTEKAGKGRRSLTVAEVREKIGGMIDRRLDRYEGVGALAAPEAKAEVTLTEIDTDPAPAEAGKRVHVTEALAPAE